MGGGSQLMIFESQVFQLIVSRYRRARDSLFGDLMFGDLMFGARDLGTFEALRLQNDIVRAKPYY